MPKTPDTAPAVAKDPAEIRRIFGANLNQLSASYKSVSELCRDLGINRTQFNRYLSGDSFPRPDVLHQICQFFGVDARILLEPLSDITNTSSGLLDHPVLQGFFDSGSTHVPEDLFPSGFFSFVRPSFIDYTLFATSLVQVHRESQYTYMRGYEPRAVLRSRGLSLHPANREFRGLIMRQEEGVMALVTHRNSLACSFNFLTRETSFQSDIWEGYAARTVREKVSGLRAARMVYQYLGRGLKAALPTARQAGLVPIEKVKPFHAHLLRLHEPFR